MTGFAARILFYLILGSWVDGLLSMAGARLDAASLVLPVVAAAIVTTAGELLLRPFGVRLAAWLPGAFVAGVTIIAVAMVIPTMLLHWSAQSAFLGCTAAVLLAAIVSPRRPPPTPTWQDAGVALSFAVLITYFCRHQIEAAPILMRTNTLQTWLDYFAHGTTISSFGSPLAIDAGDIMLPGSPRVFYHYGPFMLPAALMPISGLSGLALATGIALPLGLMVGLCGIYALAAEWIGAGPALLATWLVTCVPDASHYLVADGYLGFLWLVLSGPGSGYAIGAAALAYACALPWFERRRLGPLLAAGLLTVLLILMRAHMFLLLAPALAASFVLAALPPRWRLGVFVAGLIAACALTWLLAAGRLGGPVTALFNPADYVDFAVNLGAVASAAFVRSLGQPARLIVGALLLIPATLGLWALAFPLVAIREAASRRFRPADTVPGLMCLVYLLLIFWGPLASNGDLSEYKHRHFVLLYAVVAVWTVSRAGLLTRRSFRAISVAGLVLMLLAFRHVDAARPLASMAWAQGDYAVSVEPGIPQAAIFLRTRSRPGDIMALGGRGAVGSLAGPALELVSMTDIPCYVGRIAQAVSTRDAAIAALVRRRSEEIAAVDNSADRATALALLQSHGIRWYVALAPELPTWDTAGTEATFSAGSVYVYQVEP